MTYTKARTQRYLFICVAGHNSPTRGGSPRMAKASTSFCQFLRNGVDTGGIKSCLLLAKMFSASNLTRMSLFPYAISYVYDKTNPPMIMGGRSSFGIFLDFKVSNAAPVSSRAYKPEPHLFEEMCACVSARLGCAANVLAELSKVGGYRAI